MDANRWSNILRLEQGYAAGLAKVAARPLEAYVEVAARCNLRCEMCPIIVDPRYQPASGRPGLLSAEVFDRLEPIFPTLTRVYLFGLGEPVLHPDLVPMTRRLAAAGVEVWITTNATLIDEEKAEELARAGLHRITVSIDGATPETYERIRVRGRFDDVVRGLRALGAARRKHGKPLLYLSQVGMASNLAELPALIDLCAEVGGDGVFLEGLYPYPHPVIEDFFRREHLGHLGRDRVLELVEEARVRSAFLGIEFITRMEELASFGPEEPAHPMKPAEMEAPPLVPADADADAPAHGHPEEIVLPWACSEPWMTINVNASGEVRPCCFNDDILGDLHKQTMEEIWNGPGYTALRADQAARRVSPGCEVCVRNGRMKQSPWLVPREPVPAAAAGPLVLDTPADGELVAGPLVLVGHAAARGRSLERGELPEVWLDHCRIAWANDYALIDSDAFAAIIPIGYVSAGSHRLELRRAGGGETSAFAHRQIQTGPFQQGLAAVSRLAVTVELRAPEPRPVLRLDGRTHPLERWLCGAYGRGYLGVALLDVRALTPGAHDLDLFFTQHPRYHDQMIRLS